MPGKKTVYWDDPCFPVHGGSEICVNRQYKECRAAPGIWRDIQSGRNYETFMQALAFETKLWSHGIPLPGKVERLVRFVKDNFLADRVFCDLTDLNWQALEWCNKQNGTYRCMVALARLKRFTKLYAENSCVWCRRMPSDSISVQKERSPLTAFVNYEGRRFGVPYSYPDATARVERSGDLLRIYSADLKVLLATHTVTSSRTDSFCEGHTNPWHSQKNFPQRLYKRRFFSYQNPLSGSLLCQIRF